MSETATLGALIEVEWCFYCRARVILVAPQGDGDLEPTRLHEIPLCPEASSRGAVATSSATIDAWLGRGPEEGPEPL